LAAGQAQRTAMAALELPLFAFSDWCARADVPDVTTLARTIQA
jgi:hypothetical protein